MANCHFFVSEAEPSPIEFDLDPKEMQSPNAMLQVLQFLSRLGESLNKKVVLTEENSESLVLLSYSPGSKKYDCIDIPHPWTIDEVSNSVVDSF